MLLKIVLLTLLLYVLYCYYNSNTTNTTTNTIIVPTTIEVDRFINDYTNQRHDIISNTCSKKFIAAVQDYSKYHSDSIKKLSNDNHHDIKLIVWRCPPEYHDDCKGLGDRLQGLVTTFLIAIVTKRIMLIEWHDILSIFTPSSFNWTYIPSFIKNKTIGGVGGNLEWKYCQNELYPEICMNPDPNNYTSDVIMLNATNRPMTYSMFHDKRYNWWKEQLISIGLTHDYCFSCLLSQLIIPQQRIMRQFSPYGINLFNSNTFSIGLHVRLGDREMTGHSKLTSYHYKTIFQNVVKKRFNAANMIGCNYSNSITILFLSDSIKLRNMVSDYYSSPISTEIYNCTISKVIIPPYEPKHIDVREHKVKKHVNVSGKRQYSYTTSAGEWWLLSLCNLTILEGEESGYSRTSYAFSFNKGANTHGIIYQSPGTAKLGHNEQGL